MIRIEVRYVDDTASVSDAPRWPHLRADGVETVVIADRVFEGHSLYWLYREWGAWVMGMASPYAVPLPPEVLFHDDGRITERPLANGLPDLAHGSVKLGWWRRDWKARAS